MKKWNEIGSYSGGEWSCLTVSPHTNMNSACGLHIGELDSMGTG
jgi:hypothetical protein